MKIIRLSLLLFSLVFSLGNQNCSAQGLNPIDDPEQTLHGNWRAHRYIYDGSERLIEHTIMTFHFEEGFAVLYWSEKDQVDFCERKAFYRFRPPVLWQKVIWVNPNNARECSLDPDMQLGHTTENHVFIKNDELHVHLSLGDHEMIYVFKKVEKKLKK